MPRSVQIVPPYSQPHVHTVINDNTAYNEGALAGLGGDGKPYDSIMVIGADKGIDNKFVKLTDYATKVELFGRGNYKKYGQPSIQADALLQTGGTNLWLMRVLPVKADGGPGSAQYANLAVIAHYRYPKCVEPDAPPEAADSTDCMIFEQVSSGENPVLQPTGLRQLEVKFSIINVDDRLPGAKNPVYDKDIEDFLFGYNDDGIPNLPRGPEYTNAQLAVYGRALDTGNGTYEVTSNDLHGWISVPILYVRSTGRGRYGNNYGLRITRNVEFEYDYGVKAYNFALTERDIISAVKNNFVGMITRTDAYEASLLIDDLLESYPEGSCPIAIKTNQHAMDEIFNAYRKVVVFNQTIINAEYARDAVKVTAQNYAVSLIGNTNIENPINDNLHVFDPLFGQRLNSSELIPYYANFTAGQVDYTDPWKTYMNNLPTNLTKGSVGWTDFVTDDRIVEAQPGDYILVKNYQSGALVEEDPVTEPPIDLGGNDDDDPIDPENDENGADPDPGNGDDVAPAPTETYDVGAVHRLFRITNIIVTRDGDVNDETAEITKLEVEYNTGVWVRWDAKEYVGARLDIDVGTPLACGYDGEFEEIIAHKRNPQPALGWQNIPGTEVKRPPNEAELKLLLAREYVLAYRGMKDKYILSPARINADFIFDADYNICNNMDVKIVDQDAKIKALWANSSILTDAEYRMLSVIDSGYDFGRDGMNVADALNVKKAMFDLNNFRCKNGKMISKEEGAGCELKLDCGLIGLNRTDVVSAELRLILTTMSQFYGRNTSIDFGWYEIIDPVSQKIVPVTTSYFLAERLIPHIIQYGPNKPFVNTFARIRNMVKNSFRPEIDLIDWDVKELLYKNRINYYQTLDEGGVVQRTTQNTLQTDPSALLEENNVRVLNILKKGLERSCRNYLYEWNDPTVRKGYTDTQMEIYKPWIGNWVESLNIYFDANAWEQDRMIMHCYVDVSFRDIIKRIIVEIDISKPTSRGGVA